MPNAFKIVYNKKIVCYNFIVKKFAILTTSLLAAVIMTSGGVALAEEGDKGVTQYPESFTQTLEFSDLTDYAVGDNSYGFAEGTVIKIVENQTLTLYSFDFDVTALDYADGVYYYKDGNNAVFSLTDNSPSTHEIIQTKNATIGNFYYYVSNGEIWVLDEQSNELINLTGYSDLKQFGDSVYAVCDNVLYKLDGAKTTEIQLTYIDYSSAEEIYVGNTAEELQKGDFDCVKIATVRSKTADDNPVYITEIVLDELSDATYFRTKGTYCIGDAGAPEAGAEALLLCETGNSYIIAIGSATYIMAKSGADIAEKEISAPSYNSATVTVSGSAYAYCSPYINTSTQAYSLTTGKNVTVLAMANRENFPFLSYDYYVISYTEGENTVTGYVPAGYLSEFTFIERQPQTTTDPDYSEDDLIKTVVLILVVIVLVMVALGYLVIIGTSGKRKKTEAEPDNTDDTNTEN